MSGRFIKKKNYTKKINGHFFTRKSAPEWRHGAGVSIVGNHPTKAGLPYKRGL
jgi:hypothetical protein